jgi:hypothetical protein
MRILSLIILPVLAFLLVSFITDSPHGDKFKVSCSVCHSPSSWKLDKAIYSFDHNTTAMPLTGSHRETNCRSCHTSLVFSEAKTGCIDCHADMHENTTGPDCARCHTPESWIVENITALHRQSRFPLVGPHVTAECSECHVSASLLRFEPQGIECFDCHQANYYATTKPNHVQSGMSVNCVECHSLNSFDWNYNGSSLNHSFFPLTAGHAINECNRCHTNGTYAGLTSECVSCHQDNYNQTTNPSHVAAQYPTTCNQCHSTNPGWKPATFDHTSFPLTSGHALTDCNLCHTNGNYTNTSPECVSCHQDNYSQTTNPNHASANIPTACASCHTTNPGWKPASFTIHDSFFPIYSGSHRDEWNACTDCHANPADWASFTCTSCHEHNQASMNDHHSEVNGYTWESQACFQCHPTGRAD